jgi:site-specific DNA-methyltransferase (adenine-specific)
MTSNQCRIVCGDVQAVLPTLKTSTVDLTVTSPPYFRHRDYAAEGQIGRERTLDGYLAAIQRVLAELHRVTRKTGSCFFVIGDTYRRQKLVLVPHRVAVLADSVGWHVRNDIIWKKLDPPPESPRNRWRTGHEHVLFLTKSATGYRFNADAVRVPYSEATLRRWGKGQSYGGAKSASRRRPNDSRMRHGQTFVLNPKGCLPTDVWSLPSGDSSARHYATFPEHLIRPFIAACSDENDLVLDPFLGSGTTCRVAIEMGRHSLGIELNPEYAAAAGKSLASEVEYRSH